MSLSNNRALFDEDIRNLKNDFSLDRIADNFVYNTPIQEGMTSNTELNKSVDDFVIPYSARKIYSVNEYISDEEKRLLINVFIAFGGYTEASLCGMLNEFTPLREVPIWTDIPKSSIVEFVSLASYGDLYRNNKIISFCRGYSENENFAEEEDSHETIPDLPEAQIPLAKKDVLMRYSPMSLNSLTINKDYTVYIETDNQKVKDVTVLALDNNIKVEGALKQLTNTLFSYTFHGVPSNIKIIVDI